MSKWSIKPQEEKFGKDDVREVLCKWVKFYPQMKDGQRVGFGRFKFIILKIVLKCPWGDLYSLSWNNAAKGKPHGTFIWKAPDKLEQPPLRDAFNNRPIINPKTFKPYPDLLAKPIQVPGDEERFETPEKLVEVLTKRLGAEMVEQILDLFAERQDEILPKVAAAAKESQPRVKETKAVAIARLEAKRRAA